MPTSGKPKGKQAKTETPIVSGNSVTGGAIVVANAVEVNTPPPYVATYKCERCPESKELKYAGMEYVPMMLKCVRCRDEIRPRIREV